MLEPVSQAMKVFTIRDGGEDNPGGVIVTADRVDQGEVVRLPGVVAFPSIEAARRAIQERHPNHVCFCRSASDDPRIIESWL